MEFADHAALPGRAADRWPDRVALEFEGDTWTFAQFDQAVGRATTLLVEAGVRPGMRCVLLLENSPEYLVAQYALSRIGASFVTPNPYWTDNELTRTLGPVGAQAVIVSDRHAHRADNHPVHLHVDQLRCALRDSHIPETRSSGQTDPDRELCIPFSSGTTGLPKGVAHSAGSLSAGVAQLVRHLQLSPADRLQVSLPLCHIFGTSMSAAALAAGARITLFERFEFDRCLRHLREGEVTVWPLAGAVAHQLAGLPDLSRDHVPALRFFMWGGSAVPRQLASTITDRTGVGFLCSYGMTEAFAVAFNPVDDPGQWRLDSPGFPTVGTEIRLGNDDEIEVRSPCVARGYISGSSSDGDGPFGTDGWFRTGDVGRVDPDGRLWILDRRKDMIKVSGFQVAPAEVEYELTQHPAVADAAVIGRPDDRRGERVVAFVVPAAPVSPEQLVAAVSGQLASYKVPREIVFVDELPRTPAGKLQRAALRHH
ncbi:class I adenylate-forming enzyme family protein [Rhodococcus sp. NPDC003348]